MRNVTEETLTDAVLETISKDADPRFREIMSGLIKHLHAFALETNMTKEEWLGAIEFLYQTGKKTTRNRNEFILLSDTLGLSSMVDMISSRGDDDATAVSVLGPFYIENAPFIKNGGDLIADNAGQQTLVKGCVSSTDGTPIPNALLDVWQNAENGKYSNEDPDQDDNNLRARLNAADDGSYSFSTIRPTPYTVPEDGPAGVMLDAMGRHPWRPAHIHFKISADGYQDLITEIYPDDDEYIDADAVFGVRDSLAVSFKQTTSEDTVAQHGLNTPFLTVEYDFRLRPV
ncbi:MAG: hydroxyquinol 1,2-dioxygenase [Alphaproteobacteria bacterium]|nr:hydroxyquinol 1,2-dioxygenase [Alphaproteobacteria bacterium]